MTHSTARSVWLTSTGAGSHRDSSRLSMLTASSVGLASSSMAWPASTISMSSGVWLASSVSASSGVWPTSSISMSSAVAVMTSSWRDTVRLRSSSSVLEACGVPRSNWKGDGHLAQYH